MTLPPSSVPFYRGFGETYNKFSGRTLRVETWCRVGGMLTALLTCLWVWGLLGQAAAQDDLSVSVERQEAQVGRSVDVPIQVSGFTNVGAISLIITYDPEVLKFAGGVKTPSLVMGTPRENFLVNVVEPGELRISWFDSTGSSPINMGEGTLLTITFHQYDGGESPVAFDEGSQISNIEAEPIETSFQDGRVAESLKR